MPPSPNPLEVVLRAAPTPRGVNWDVTFGVKDPSPKVCENAHPPTKGSPEHEVSSFGEPRAKSIMVPDVLFLFAKPSHLQEFPERLQINCWPQPAQSGPLSPGVPRSVPGGRAGCPWTHRPSAPPPVHGFPSTQKASAFSPSAAPDRSLCWPCRAGNRGGGPAWRVPPAGS